MRCHNGTVDEHVCCILVKGLSFNQYNHPLFPATFSLPVYQPSSPATLLTSLHLSFLSTSSYQRR